MSNNLAKEYSDQIHNYASYQQFAFNIRRYFIGKACSDIQKEIEAGLAFNHFDELLGYFASIIKDKQADALLIIAWANEVINEIVNTQCGVSSKDE